MVGWSVLGGVCELRPRGGAVLGDRGLVGAPGEEDLDTPGLGVSASKMQRGSGKQRDNAGGFTASMSSVGEAEQEGSHAYVTEPH